LAQIMDEELARKLQAQELREAGGVVNDEVLPPGATVEEADAIAQVVETPGPPEEAEQFVRDEELARALQAQEDDYALALRLQNSEGKQPRQAEEQGDVVAAVDDEEERPLQSRRVITKHDAELCGRRNAAALARYGDGEMGDLSGDGVLLPNPAYNALKEHSRRGEARAGRKREAIATASSGHRSGGGVRSEAVLDDATRLTLLGLLNTGVIAQLGGVVGQGKEARIFAATAGDGSELAVKVFRSTGELRNRVEYADGELLRELGRDKPHAWRIVRLWAQRELRTLAKMHNLGVDNPAAALRSPEPIGLYGGNVLVMRFIGSGSVPAPTLHEAVESGRITKSGLRRVAVEIAMALRTMFHRCGVVHADLSEFNLLYNSAGHVVVIDVAQSVPAGHRNAISFLRRDCAAIAAFFRRCGVPAALSARELFLFATDEGLEEADETARLESLMKAAEARGAPSREQVAEDENFAKSDFGARPEISVVPQQASSDSEVEIALLAPDGEEDDEVLEFLAEQLTGEGFPLGTLSDETQLSREHRKQHMSACFPRIRELAMSHVARINGEICGALLVDDLAAPPPTATAQSLDWLQTLGPIAELNAAAKAPVLATNPAFGEVAYLSWGAVSATTRGNGVMRGLLAASLEVAKNRGYKRALGVCVTAWALSSLTDIGFSEVHRVPYDTFEIAKMPTSGMPGRPFSRVLAPHVAAVTMQKSL